MCERERERVARQALKIFIIVLHEGMHPATMYMHTQSN